MSGRSFESPMAEQHLAAMKKFLLEYSETMIDLEEAMADRVRCDTSLSLSLSLSLTWPWLVGST